MKKYRYAPELIDRIQNDPDYVLLLFAIHFVKTNDKLFLPKRRKSGDYTMRCPFHKERTPSFRYSPKLRRFKCFGCGLRGPILTLYQKYYHFSFAEAIGRALALKKRPALLDGTPAPKENRNQYRIDFPQTATNNINIGSNDEDDLPF